LPPPVAHAEFRPERLTALAELDGHFWVAGRRELMHRLLPDHLVRDRDVIDIGCGTGSALVELHRRGARVTGVDALPEAVERAALACPEARVIHATSDAIPVRSSSMDGVLLLDVLEHVDEASTLTELSRILRPEGWLLVTVPAGMWLWSYRDEDAGHMRRYSRRRLEEALNRGGFVTERFTRYQCLLLPAVAMTRVLGRRSAAWRDREEQVRGPLNATLAAVNRLEARVGARVTLPWGTSLVALARSSS
jgi:SAM-dependent methyltransferase